MENMENENMDNEYKENENVEVKANTDQSALNQTPKHQGLAIASLILGGVSLICCFFPGITIIPALIGIIFGLIAVVGGEGKSRVMGGIGLAVSAIGLLLGIFMLVTLISMINWDNFTLENLMEIQKIDPDNSYEVNRWLQQFFKYDIS